MTAEVKQRTDHQVDHSVYPAPKKNHGTMSPLDQKFAEIIGNRGVPHLVFKLSNITASMERVTYTAKSGSYTEEDQLYMETLIYGDRKHKGEAATNKRSAQLWPCSNKLVSSRTGFIIGDLSC